MPADRLLIHGLLLALIWLLQGSPCLAADNEESKILESYGHSPALDHFFTWVRTGDPSEMRTFWFLRGDEGIGMCGVANLTTCEVKEWRDVYNWALQGGGPSKLSHYQIVKLREILKNLPKSAPPKELKNLVILSVPLDQGRRLYVYDRTNLPSTIVRIFDFSGVYIQTSDEESSKPYWKPKMPSDWGLYHKVNSELLEPDDPFGARGYFSRWVSYGDPWEVKTLWFPAGEEKVGMTGVINFLRHEITTERYVWGKNTQSAEISKLNGYQLLKLQVIITDLPESVRPKDPKDWLIISVPLENERKLHLYDRTNLPAAIIRIFDITGACIDSDKAR